MRIKSAVLPFGCLLCFFAVLPRAQAGAPSLPGLSGCRDDLVDADNYKVRSVRFFARFAPVASLAAQAPQPGTPYTRQLDSDLIHLLHGALEKETVRDPNGETEFQLFNTVSAGKGAQVGVSFVTTCVRVVPEPDCLNAPGIASAKCVDIDVVAYAARINTADVWSNLLDNTRSNAPTFLSRVPAPLLALNPKAGVGYDRRYGASGLLGFSSNLLDLSKNLNRRALKAAPTRLDVTAQARKSLQDSFYDASTALAFSHRFAKVVDSLAVRASLSGDHTPLGTGDYLRNSFAGSFDVKIRTKAAALSVVTLGAGYVRSGNRLNNASTASSTGSNENSFTFRAISDGQWAGGFSRFAVWADGTSPDSFAGSYHRFAALLGYARDFQVAPHQAISLEVLSGGGQIWGTPPAYDRFFGGNSAKSFLYESTDSPVLTSLPSGPLLRSLGNNQAAAISTSALEGGASYWHVNVNLAFPIPKWSRPLIPDISIEGIPKTDTNCKKMLDADGNFIEEDRSLGEILKSQGACAKNTLAQVYRQQGLPRPEAEARAAKDLAGVDSILAFLADRANLVSVKPLLLFDVARIYGAGSSGDHTRYGMGAGFQLTVVVARFEAGYMAGLRRFPGDPPGNFLVRLVFQNLF